MKASIFFGWLASAASVIAQCSLPTTYNWTSTGALAEPDPGPGGLTSFTTAPYQEKHLVYGTTYTPQAIYASMTFSPVSDFTELATATQTAMDIPSYALTLFFFAPKKHLGARLSMGAYGQTSQDPTNPNGWSAEQALFNGTIENSVTGPLDTALRNDNSTIVLSEATNKIFEGVQVYKIKGQKSLDGNWTANAVEESSPFAGKANSGATWTDYIGQADITRDRADQTNTIDLCNLKVLYHGYNRSNNPWQPMEFMRPALLTFKKV
ncbi:arabinoxylan arabinofuranohydrolase [Coprinopsis sp. MPI-PUGE-AT-0042]|nr:arabinoxylan arabinofuranohydrolase [Coprinopsis sp. MPI-PUGE-AT-0042]